MSSQPNEPRELTPVQKFWDGSNGFKDMSPHVQKVGVVEEVPMAGLAEGPSDAELAQVEADEAEAALTPAPKDESVLESADSQASIESIAPERLETPVPQPDATPTTETESEDAETESGKASEPSEVEPPSQPTTKPSPATSSPSFSLPKPPGAPTLPA